MPPPAARPGCEPIRLLLDHEPQRAGEDEVTTALRLLVGVIGSYPRAFDLVLADALDHRRSCTGRVILDKVTSTPSPLVTTAPFFNFLLSHDKHALTVLKDDRRHLYQDAAALLAGVPSKAGFYRNRPCLWRDFPDLLTWPRVNIPVRVIRSLETYSVKRQLDGKDELKTSDWIRVTPLPLQPVSTERVAGFGHQRWDIENHGFNELVHGWHADHIEPNAVECFLLIAFLACNIFHAFFVLNLKPEIRKHKLRSSGAVSCRPRSMPVSTPPSRHESGARPLRSARPVQLPGFHSKASLTACARHRHKPTIAVLFPPQNTFAILINRPSTESTTKILAPAGTFRQSPLLVAGGRCS